MDKEYIKKLTELYKQDAIHKLDDYSDELTNYITMASQQIEAHARHTQKDLTIYADYLADIAKGLIPVPEVTSHEYPNYPIFRTYKDGSFESGDYEVYQLWLMKALDPVVMKKKKINLVRLGIVLSGGVGVIFLGIGLLWGINIGIIKPTQNFISWFQEDQKIVSPWNQQRAKPSTMTVEELRYYNQIKQQQGKN